MLGLKPSGLSRPLPPSACAEALRLRARLRRKLNRHLARGLELYRTMVGAYNVRERKGAPL